MCASRYLPRAAGRPCRVCSRSFSVDSGDTECHSDSSDSGSDSEITSKLRSRWEWNDVIGDDTELSFTDGNCRNAARKDSGINEASELSKAEEPSARAVPRLASSGAAAFSPCGWPVAPPAASRRGEAVPGEALSEERGPEAFPELSFVYLRSLGSALERECGECSRSTGGRALLLSAALSVPVGGRQPACYFAVLQLANLYPAGAGSSEGRWFRSSALRGREGASVQELQRQSGMLSSAAWVSVRPRSHRDSFVVLWPGSKLALGTGGKGPGP
ncbi:hypothetical protein CB1_000707028 [Camelus ferus]|nr:hypothetical protein CB1_000707028 [Camelus ferus]